MRYNYQHISIKFKIIILRRKFYFMSRTNDFRTSVVNRLDLSTDIHFVQPLILSNRRNYNDINIRSKSYQNDKIIHHFIFFG